MLDLGVKGVGGVAPDLGDDDVGAIAVEGGHPAVVQRVDPNDDVGGHGPGGAATFAPGDELADHVIVTRISDGLVALDDVEGNVGHFLFGHAGVDADVGEGAVESVDVVFESEDLAIECA